MSLNPTPADPAALLNYPANSLPNDQTQAGVVYKGRFYNVLNVYNQFGDGFRYERIFREGVELDAANAPKGGAGYSAFDGDHTIIYAGQNGAIFGGAIFLQNFDLATETWGAPYAGAGGITNAGPPQAVILNGSDVIVLASASSPPTGDFYANIYTGGSWIQTLLAPAAYVTANPTACVTPNGILIYYPIIVAFIPYGLFTLLGFDYSTITTQQYDTSQWNAPNPVGNMVYYPQWGFAVLPATATANSAMPTFIAVDPATLGVTVFLGAPAGAGAGGYSGIDPAWGQDNGVTLGGCVVLPNFSFDGTYLIGVYWCVDLTSGDQMMRMVWTMQNPLDVAGWNSTGERQSDGTIGVFPGNEYNGWPTFGVFGAFTAAAAPSSGSVLVTALGYDQSFNNQTFVLLSSTPASPTFPPGSLAVVPTLIDVQIVFRGVKRYQSGTVCEPLKELQDLPHVKKAV